MNLLRRTPVLQRALIVLLGAVVAIAITFFVPSITNSLLTSGAMMTIVVLGLTFLTGWSGQVSIGNSGFVAIGAYATAIVLVHHPHTPIVLSLVIAIAAGAVAGLLVGLPATRLRGPYLAGMTLAFGSAVPPLIQNLSSITGGQGGLLLQPPLAPKWFSNLVSTSSTLAVDVSAQWLAILSFVVAAIAIFLMANIFHSRTGRAMRLIRDNDVAAELAGINLPRTRALAFMISAAYAGLGGGVLALTQGSVNPQNFLIGLSITMLSLMVLGGLGTLTGAILAGLIYAFSNNAVSWITNTAGIDPTSNFGANLKGMIFGALLVVTMLTAPRGLVGLGQRAKNRLFRRP